MRTRTMDFAMKHNNLWNGLDRAFDFTCSFAGSIMTLTLGYLYLAISDIHSKYRRNPFLCPDPGTGTPCSE